MLAKRASRPATQDALKKVETSFRGEIKRVESTLKGDIGRLDGAVGRLDGAVGRLDRKIDENTKRLAVEIVGTNERITRLESSLREEMTRNTDKILTALDRHAQTSEANNRAVVLHGHALSENAQTLSDHERRITALEPKA